METISRVKKELNLTSRTSYLHSSILQVQLQANSELAVLSFDFDDWK